MRLHSKVLDQDLVSLHSISRGAKGQGDPIKSLPAPATRRPG